MSIRASLFRVKILLDDSFCFLKPLPQTASIEVPYFSQYASPELAEEFDEGRRALHTDPKWQEFGAADPKEYEKWAWSICGLACLKMVLSAKDNSASSVRLIDLAKEFTEASAFEVSETSISPLRYREFCAFASKKYGLNATPVSALSFCKIKEQVAKGNFVIVSVNSNIRHHKNPTPSKRGGHLVLIVGYNEEGLYIHNPDGYQSNSSQERTFVPYFDFKRFFAYRGIIINGRTTR